MRLMIKQKRIGIQPVSSLKNISRDVLEEINFFAFHDQKKTLETDASAQLFLRTCTAKVFVYSNFPHIIIFLSKR